MTATHEADLHKTIEALKADLAELRTDLKTATRQAGHRGKEMAHDAKELVQEKLHAAWNTAREKGGQAVKVTEKQISDHPWTSVMIAFGAGLAVSMLVRMRR